MPGKRGWKGTNYPKGSPESFSFSRISSCIVLSLRLLITALVLSCVITIACNSSVARMSARCKKIYLHILLAGSLGFIICGLGASVSGGILLTTEFQTAMGVRRYAYRAFVQKTANTIGCVPAHHHHFHDRLNVPVGTRSSRSLPLTRSS